MVAGNAAQVPVGDSQFVGLKDDIYQYQIVDILVAMGQGTVDQVDVAGDHLILPFLSKVDPRTSGYQHQLAEIVGMEGKEGLRIPGSQGQWKGRIRVMILSVEPIHDGIVLLFDCIVKAQPAALR